MTLFFAQRGSGTSAFDDDGFAEVGVDVGVGLVVVEDAEGFV